MEDGVEGFFCDSTEAYKVAIMKFKNMDEQKYQQFCFNTSANLHKFDTSKYCADLIEYAQHNFE